MIELTCPHSASSLKIEEQYAGQRGRCNKCGGAISVPGPSPSIDLDDPCSAFHKYPPPGLDEGKPIEAAQIGRSILGYGCLMPFFLLGLFILIAILSPSEPSRSKAKSLA